MTAPAAAIATHDDQGRPVRRYPIPDPETGVIADLFNISSIIDVLQSFGLVDWKLKMAAVGFAHRLDLQAAVSVAHLIPQDSNGKWTARNRAIREAVDAAIEHGQTIDPGVGYLKNDFGTSLHLMTDLIDEGAVDDIMSLPASIAEQAEQYVRLVAAHGVEWTHREVTIWGGNYAGTGDRFGRFSVAPRADEVLRIFEALDLGRGTFVFDTKSGRVKKQAALQLAALANGRTIFDAATGQHLPMPDDMRTDIGFIIELHAHRASSVNPDRCQLCDRAMDSPATQLVPVDLTAAWPAFQGALAVKLWDETKPLHAALVAPPPTAPVDEAPSKVVDLMGQLAASVDAAKTAAKEQRDAENAEAADLLDGMNETPTGVPPASSFAILCGGPGGCQTVEIPATGPDPEPASGEPTHISEALKHAIAAIPDDPTAGTVDPDGHRILDRRAKTAWLTERLGALIATHGDTLPIVWPPDTPTFRQHRQAGALHTIDQLEAIEQAINAAERQVAAPFPEPDPSDTNHLVKADDPRVVQIGQRFAVLPPDIKDDIADRAAEANIRRFTLGEGREDDVTWWHTQIDAAEAQHTAQREVATAAAGVLAAYDQHISTDWLLATLGNYIDAPTVWQANRLDELADALGLSWLQAVDGELQLDDEGRKHLEVEFGGRRGVLNAAKTAADLLGRPKPTKADDVYADVLLAAHLTLIESEPTEQVSPHPAA